MLAVLVLAAALHAPPLMQSIQPNIPAAPDAPPFFSGADQARQIRACNRFHSAVIRLYCRSVIFD